MGGINVSMKIVIIEDEDRTREGIVKLIKKQHPQYSIIGEAENGLAGFDMIMYQKPDVVIVDIKMPILDGIGMIMKLKENGIIQRIIILSGYSDFEYTHKAIKLGVFDYLLKPITVDDLNQVLNNVENDMYMSKANWLEKPGMFNSLEHIFRNILLYDLKESDDIYKYASQKYNVDINGNFIIVEIYLGSDYCKIKDMTHKNIIILLERYKKIKYCIFETEYKSDLVILIYDFNDSSSFKQYFNTMIINEIHRTVNDHIVFGWICFKGMVNIKNHLHIIRKELSWSIILGNDAIISYPEVTKITTKQILYPIHIETNAKTAVCNFDISKLDMIFKYFLSWWHKDLYEPSNVINAFIRFASSILNIIKELNFDLFESINQKEILQGILNSVTWFELENALIILLKKISSKNNKKTNISNLIIMKVLSLIDEFYKDGITLDEIATKLNITPEYLGSLFNKELGVNFSVYIKDYRIKKAKELLLLRKLRAYEVAKLVGYSDPRYFSRVFKDVTGMTPCEYQKTYK
jgi:two-component system, response regulator YesN